MPSRRSIAIDGTITSISMENIFWEEVDRFAAQRGEPWQNFLRNLLEELSDPPNRAAAIKEAVVELLRREDRGRNRGLQSHWVLDSSEGRTESTCHSLRLLAGRSEGNDIVIQDHEVSRHHVMLAFDNRFWWAVDLESKNGIWFKNKAVKVLRLRPGDEIGLGESTLQLVR